MPPSQRHRWRQRRQEAIASAQARERAAHCLATQAAVLPPEVLHTATAALDRLAAIGQDPLIPVDLVRLESLPPHWQQRIRERAIVL